MNAEQLKVAHNDYVHLVAGRANHWLDPGEYEAGVKDWFEKYGKELLEGMLFAHRALPEAREVAKRVKDSLAHVPPGPWYALDQSSEMAEQHDAVWMCLGIHPDDTVDALAYSDHDTDELADSKIKLFEFLAAARTDLEVLSNVVTRLTEAT